MTRHLFKYCRKSTFSWVDFVIITPDRDSIENTKVTKQDWLHQFSPGPEWTLVSIHHKTLNAEDCRSIENY